MPGRIPEPVSVLMPVCNEVAVIEGVVREWESDVFRYLPAGSELVFDDGASHDGTLETLERLRGELPFLRILRSGRDGFGASARRLYQTARCALVFFTDSDGQYVARDFWKVAALRTSCDLAHGAKLDRRDPLYRKLASGVFNRVAESLFHAGIPDLNSAFRLLPKALVDDLLPQVRHMSTMLNAELLLRAAAAGYRVKAVGVEHRPRASGKSRGLPPGRFGRECLENYRGLRRLHRELGARRAANVVAAAPAEPCEDPLQAR